MSSLVIKIDQGELKGCTKTTENGFKYHSFCGIPYAKPPVGDLKFKDPQPADGWTGVRDASQEGPIHCQLDKLQSDKMVGQEDSLYLNVHVPANQATSTKLPVMVWIHGGSFQTGSGNSLIYGPDYLIQNDVIVVTLNYRLGIFGFLCLHTPEAPGNAGLKDQLMALKWVKNNIDHFGGDSSNITIFGESAGSASVSLLMVSPLAKGLFCRAIMQSGVCLNGWTMQTRPEETAYAFAEKLGFKTKDKDEILRILRDTSPEILYTLEGFTLSDKYNFCPVVEKSWDNGENYLPRSPMEIIMSGEYNSVPFICGNNSKEGILFLVKQLEKNPAILKCKTFEESGLNIDNFLPQSVNDLDADKRKEVMKAIIDRYFSNEGFVDGYVNLMSDTSFIMHAIHATKLLSKQCKPSYYYYFDYNGAFNLYNYIAPMKYSGAAHADDLGYLFKPDIERIKQFPSLAKAGQGRSEVKVNPTKEDLIVVQRMVKMWTNFAKHGDPVPAMDHLLNVPWKPVSDDGEINCLNIGKDLEMVVDPLRERVQFWNDLHKMMRK